MLRFALPVFLTLASISHGLHYPLPYYSAASQAQIRFALENKYDDTGPGAKEPEFAYSTYKTLEEALLGYLDDPDTKLPEEEREKAVASLAKQNKPYQNEYTPNEMFKRYYPKTVEEYTGYRQEEVRPKQVGVYNGYRLPQPQLVLTKLRTQPPKKYYAVKTKQSGGEILEPYRVEKLQFRPSPVRLDELREREYQKDQYDPHPKYTFSYGVSVPDTGDHKSAQETREGGTVRGYYSFMDADGKQRTVHYTADDKDGFRATVERE